MPPDDPGAGVEIEHPSAAGRRSTVRPHRSASCAPPAKGTRRCPGGVTAVRSGKNYNIYPERTRGGSPTATGSPRSVQVAR